ncbi:MAG: sodium/solute symporter [Acidimicrobiia bacterium]|nr:sodium/solute symporter [Acidimicrobiia bacterium]
MTGYLSFLDTLVALVYLGTTMGVGFWMVRRQKTTADYFIANRRIPAWAVAFTMLGTVISSASFVAHPGAVFARNLYLLPSHLVLPFILLFVVLFVVPFYRRVIGMSSYEYFGRRFGHGARFYTSAGFVLLRVLDLGITLYTAAIAIDVMTGWDIPKVIVGLGLLTTLYTMVGGIEGVVWTDVLQGVVLLGGMFLILAILLFQPAAGPVSVLSTAYAGGKFGLGNFDWSWQSLYNQDATVWIWLLAGLTMMGRSYTIDQNIVQRYLVARSDREAQQGALVGAVSCLPVWMTFMLIGACLWSFYRTTGAALPAEIAAKPDNILPYFVATQLPAGIVGLILAAILAAAQSSVSADLNSISTVLTSDYFTHFLPQSSDRSRLAFGRSAVLATGVVTTMIAVLLTRTRSVSAAEVGLTLITIVAGGILGLFALGFFTRKATTRGAYVGIACCILFTGWATLSGPLAVDLGFNFTFNYLLIGILSQPILFITGYLASLLLPGQSRDISGLTFWDLRTRTKLPGV